MLINVKLLLTTLILLFINTAFSSTASKAISNGFVPISSEYKDQGTQKNVSLEGSCLLFKLIDDSGKMRLFGITSAHVTQGSDSLTVNRQLLHSQNSNTNQASTSPAQILGRLANNDDDIELIEFQNNLFEPLAEWNNSIHLITISIDAFKDWLNQQSNAKKAIVRMNFNSGFLSDIVLKGDWVQSESQHFSQNYEHHSQYNFGTSQSEHEQLTYLPVENEIHAQAILGPAMSGSPLLTIHSPIPYSKSHTFKLPSVLESLLKENTFQYSVIGITKGNRRHQPGSLFTSAQPIADLINAYLKNKRGLTSETQWHLRYELTYRTFGDDSSEIIPSTERLGGFGRSDGGGFSRTDSGGFSRTDSGGFGKTDGSDPIGQTQRPLSSQLSFDHWLKFNIYPSGVKYKNNFILGFTLFDHVGFYVDGNPDRTLEFFRLSMLGRMGLWMNGVPRSEKIIPMNADFISLLKNKFLAYVHQIQREDETKKGQLKNNEIPLSKSLMYSLLDIQKHYVDPSEFDSKEELIKSYLKLLDFKLETVHPTIEYYFKNKNDHAQLNFTLGSTTRSEVLKIENQKITIHDGVIEFQLMGPKPEYDEIKFKLDQYGRLLNEKNEPSPSFMPMIRIQSQHHAYLVDLKSLFFVDTSRFTSTYINPTGVLMDEKPSLHPTDLIHILLEGPLLRFKLEKLPQMYEVQFNKIDNFLF